MDLSYPIGRFSWPKSITPEERTEWIGIMAAAPARFREAVAGLGDGQLDTPYRPGGWTVRQVIHHVPESHMHSYARFRFALTEDDPAIKPYDEAKTALLHDASTMPVEVSLQLLTALHSRFVDMLNSMSEADFARTFRHPAIGTVRLDQNLGLYAWHSRHHEAHVTGLRERMGW
jgi:hypothetical protein